ncbi:unnamed protein product, partial [Lymnaea stagnalis]
RRGKKDVNIDQEPHHVNDYFVVRKAVPKVAASRMEAPSNYSRSGESESYPSNKDSGTSEVSSTDSFVTKLGSESSTKQTATGVRTKFPKISPEQNQTVSSNKTKLVQSDIKIQKIGAVSETKIKSNRSSDTIVDEKDNGRSHGSENGASDEKTDMPEKNKSESVFPQIVRRGRLMRDEHRTMSNNSRRDSNPRICNNSQDLAMKRLSIDTYPVSAKGKVGQEKEAVSEEEDTVPERPDLKFTKKVSLVGEPTKNKLELCDFVNHDIIGGDEVCVTSFGPTKLTYLDYVASGRPLKCIENYIRYHVMPLYANTHTEVSHFAAQTTRFREEARSIIRESVHATEDDAVIFCGSGSTAAIHKVIHALDLRRSPYTIPPVVFIGPYEHHSNILPWIEAKAKVIRIQLSRNGLIDMVHLEEELKEVAHGPERLVIGSFSAASNVTGILTDTVAISKLMHKYKGYALFDYACAAPYVEIDMNCTEQGPLAYKDAVFISTHKFLGGPQTPGILIAKRSMFRNQVPHGAGGGTVVFVRRHGHKYHKEAEHREEGGTPAVIESIRAGLVFKLKETFTSTFIMGRETRLLQRAIAAWSNHPDLLILGDLSVDRLPIFSMLFRNRATGRLLHHDFVAMLLNDLFGLQVRSGCACAALYGLDLLGIDEDVAEKYEQLITQSGTMSNERNSVKEDDDDATTDNVIFK